MDNSPRGWHNTCCTLQLYGWVSNGLAESWHIMLVTFLLHHSIPVNWCLSFYIYKSVHIVIFCEKMQCMNKLTKLYRHNWDWIPLIKVKIPHTMTWRGNWCICVYRLSETCSHIGAVLFYVETGHRLNSVTPTGEKCKWVMPTAVKQVSLLPYLL